MATGGELFRIGAKVLVARGVRPFGTGLAPRRPRRGSRELGDRTQTPPFVDMEAVAREANRCGSRHPNALIGDAVPPTGLQRLGVARRLFGVRFATKYVLDIVVIVVIAVSVYSV